jgi:hypothetical protein
MSFKSDAHRKWWFANNLGTRMDTGPNSQSFIKTDADARYYVNQAAFQQSKDREFDAFSSSSQPSRSPMPSLTAQEKQDWARYRGDFGK